MAGLAVRERRPYAAADVLTDPRIRYDAGAARESGRQRRPRAARRAADRARPACSARWRWPTAPDACSTPRTRGWRRPSPTRRPWRSRTRDSTARRTRRRREAEELARLAALADRESRRSMRWPRASPRAWSRCSRSSRRSSARLRADGGLVALASAGRARASPSRVTCCRPAPATSGRAVERGAAVAASHDLRHDSDAESHRRAARADGPGGRRRPARRCRCAPRAGRIGSLSISDRAGRVFSEAEARLLQAFADQAALALENARLYAETTRRRHEAEELARLAQTLTESLDVSDVVGRTVESVLPLFGARPRCCGSCSPTARWWRWRSGGRAATSFEPGHVTPSGHRRARSRRRRGTCGRGPRHSRRSDASALADDLREELRDCGRSAAMLAVPLRVKGMVIGALGDRRPSRPAVLRGRGAPAPGLRRPGGAGAGERAAVLAGARRGGGRSPRWPRSSASSPPSSTPSGCSADRRALGPSLRRRGRASTCWTTTACSSGERGRPRARARSA